MLKYRLDDLGWYQFEWLCQSLLKARCGLAVEAWGGHSDFGRDAYSKGDLNCEIPFRGPVIFQAKFVENANASGAKPFSALKAAVNAEVDRIKERKKKRTLGSVASYVLLTNTPVSAEARDKIGHAIRAELQNTDVTVWGEADLAAMLDDTPNV